MNELRILVEGSVHASLDIFPRGFLTFHEGVMHRGSAVRDIEIASANYFSVTVDEQSLSSGLQHDYISFFAVT